MSALKIKKGSTKHSAYNLRPSFSETIETHTLAVIVDNEPGVLARVIGLFSGRGYNIDSLTVAEVDHEGHQSRITIVTTGTPQVIEQIKAQLGRIVPVHEVHDLTVEGMSVERELALLKVAGSGDKRVEALRLADIFRAQVVDSTLESFVFQITGTPEKVDAFADLMRPLGLAEIARTGVAALSRGS
ncbi:acetolactate synthase, small subunit [Roseivivax halotolerans]|jgi:acetolactate synthase-1/3 small subunit|uniref:Acetolactate synthase small subunit n=1 Tax=Roseivivax halotolerans TaxID=93684 RepID=A0A1I5X583_9RHOB|nr:MULTISPECIES: acetolactate synthase small subunit [Roseivivax]QFT63453.1 Acetolactate synthase isozyme 3 small subunit [Roseivivax sp. THAF30]SFQ27133.1 acetolactate synthase, small subunit [Roseivivax halotolerans]